MRAGRESWPTVGWAGGESTRLLVGVAACNRDMHRRFTVRCSVGGRSFGEVVKQLVAIGNHRAGWPHARDSCERHSSARESRGRRENRSKSMRASVRVALARRGCDGRARGERSAAKTPHRIAAARAGEGSNPSSSSTLVRRTTAWAKRQVIGRRPDSTNKRDCPNGPASKAPASCSADSAPGEAQPIEVFGASAAAQAAAGPLCREVRQAAGPNKLQEIAMGLLDGRIEQLPRLIGEVAAHYRQAIGRKPAWQRLHERGCVPAIVFQRRDDAAIACASDRFQLLDGARQGRFHAGVVAHDREDVRERCFGKEIMVNRQKARLH